MANSLPIRSSYSTSGRRITGRNFLDCSQNTIPEQEESIADSSTRQQILVRRSERVLSGRRNSSLHQQMSAASAPQQKTCVPTSQTNSNQSRDDVGSNH